MKLADLMSKYKGRKSKPISREKNVTDYSMSTPNPDWKTMDKARITSIDVGEVNFCLRVEDRSRSGLDIVTVGMEKIQLEGNIYLFLQAYLDRLFTVINQSNVVVIERQLSKNKKCDRIMQHVITWCMNRLYYSLPHPFLCTISPKLKYTRLGCPDLSHGSMKNKWGPERAMKLLEDRGDVKTLDLMKASTKKDDFADVILQIEALYVINKLSPTKKITIIM